MKYPQSLLRHLNSKSVNLRRYIIQMIADAGSGHPGGSLSATDIITVLYFHTLHINPNNPRWPDRDRFILSKGHACPVLYAALTERGFFTKKALKTLRAVGSILQGHPDMRKTPGVDMTSGSLGQGLSAGLGIALAAKLDRKSYRVFVMLGCGELQEGQVWEAAMAASHFRADNLTVIIDYNNRQVDGVTNEIMSVEPIGGRWQMFGWDVREIDGHDFSQILRALEETGKISGKPQVIIAHTIKGKGVSFMEGKVEWHGTAPNNEQTEKALTELTNRATVDVKLTHG